MEYAVALPTEKALDRALDKALRTRADFAAWFLNQTKFAGTRGVWVWSRADNPWTKYELEVSDPETGGRKKLVREGETDILDVFRTERGDRIALHIENKRERGQFAAYQPQGYAARARKWLGNDKYGGYQQWDTVLVAPRAFRERFLEEANVFGAFIAYEDIAAFVPAFGER
jgi:hypothetical protein